MSNGYTWRPAMTRQELVALYVTKGMTLREIAACKGISLKIVQTLMRRHGVAARRAVKRDQRGPKNASWKGSRASYKALHLRVYSKRGRPARCEKCGTTEAKRFEWASRTKKYEDPEDYLRLCRRCHRIMDNTVKNLGRYARRKNA